MRTTNRFERPVCSSPHPPLTPSPAPWVIVVFSNIKLFVSVFVGACMCLAGLFVRMSCVRTARALQHLKRNLPGVLSARWVLQRMNNVIVQFVVCPKAAKKSFNNNYMIYNKWNSLFCKLFVGRSALLYGSGDRHNNLQTELSKRNLVTYVSHGGTIRVWKILKAQ